MSVRKATNLLLDVSLLSEAQELKLDVSLAAEEGIASAVKAENADAVQAANDHVEKHSLPLARFSQF